MMGTQEQQQIIQLVQDNKLLIIKIDRMHKEIDDLIDIKVGLEMKLIEKSFQKCPKCNCMVKLQKEKS